ncbi:hypothetical protein [Sphingomonas aerophila]|uniref:Tetratricopeptide repeat protein n=1 Tax=Sphingomonas aerophila TaxID=1344948 RepID=A0A7W9BBI0_9SPHN|nr:hypothetical protein [Sphingomonas aerophila]MBB5714152.1 hypothetical protein [Sphingomonas aerophila]
MLSILLLLPQVAKPVSSPPNDVVVVGHRAEDDLAKCLARACSPAEEVEASLQASVEQFADGRYNDAQRTLQRAIRRNRDHQAELPGPVSSLYATLATIAEHQGDEELWLSSARSNVRVLRRHLGAGSDATLEQRLAFADTLIGLGKRAAADDVCKDVQRSAGERGRTGLASSAAFRRAWLALLGQQDRKASRLADEAVLIAGSADRTMADLREIVRARIAIRHGDAGALDALAARLRQSTSKPPVLLFAPPIDDPNSKLLFADDPRVRFADVGYWVQPNGRTAGVEVLRTSGLGQWSRTILKQVSQRRYVPLDASPGQPGMYRIDRFTVRGSFGTPTGSHVSQRTGEPSIHIVDLTETDAMSVARRQHSEEGPR